MSDSERLAGEPASSQKPVIDPRELFDRIVEGDPGKQRVAKAVMNALESFIRTAGEVTDKLVEHTGEPDPEIRREMAKLQKAVIEMTIRAVERGPCGGNNPEDRR